MPDTPRGRAALRAVAAFCALAILMSFTAGGVALTQKFRQGNERRMTQLEINKAICASSANARNGLRALVINSDNQLGTPKAAGYQYYKDHPEELRFAHFQNARVLSKYLPVIKCDSQGRPYNP